MIALMRTSTAEQLPWPGQAGLLTEAEPEPRDLAACLAAPTGLDLVVEMAHDLRSPLTSVVFLTEALQDESSNLTEDQRRQLGLIYSAALSLCATASDVVELARGGNGHGLVAQEPTPFSVGDVLVSTRSMILPIAEEKGLDLRLVHGISEPRLGHARALSRVLLNLATNALKYTDAGFVEITARPLGPTRVEFSIRDTGDGIDPASLHTLYQPFRASTAGLRHYFSSSGLGLAICRKLVKAMGSQLQVETRPSWGTRFFFELDLPPAPPTA